MEKKDFRSTTQNFFSERRIKANKIRMWGRLYEYKLRRDMITPEEFKRLTTI